MKINKKIIIFISVFLANFYSYAQRELLIPELKSNDIMFSQYQAEVLYSNKTITEGKIPPITFYTYITKKDDDFFSIAARTCIRQETLATLNSIDNSRELKIGQKIYLPSCDGIFINENANTILEKILYNQYKDKLDSLFEIKLNGKKLYFAIGQRFTPEQRSFFLKPGFYNPLEQAVLTSAFGKRISPISGKWKNHNGIDLASPYGSKVYSCRSGIVKKIVKNDYIYGNYIEIKHNENITSLYAHLSEILIKENETISGGQLIGKVGTTGLTTGPHLHFEIKENGKAEDPLKFLN